MAVSEFPARPNISYPSEPVGAGHLILQDLPNEFVISEAQFKDGGKSRGMESTSAIIRRWVLIYDGLSAAEAAVFDAHYAEAFSSLLGFQFRHPRTNELISDCHYESYNYPQHEHLNCQRREITLIKSPA